MGMARASRFLNLFGKRRLPIYRGREGILHLDCRQPKIIPSRDSSKFCVRRFSLGSESHLNGIDSHNLTGDVCYHRALDALSRAKEQEEARKKRQSAEQFEAWQNAQSAAATKPTRTGVAVVKTIAKQARRDRKQKHNEDEELKQVAKQWMETAAFQHGHAKALVQLGNNALQEANTELGKGPSVGERSTIEPLVREAMDLYEMAGNNGTAEGWFNLGHLRWTGYPSTQQADTQTVQDPEPTIIVPDKKGSLEAFQKAIDLGDKDAMYFVGVQVLSSDQYSEETKRHLVDGLRFVEKAAGLSHGGALYYLALLHLNGHSGLGIVPCSPKEFVRRLDLAAHAGDADALFLRGHCFYHGEDGYDRDYQKALSDFTDAAEAGNADAAVSAGAMLHQGKGGVKQNQSRAFELYQLAGEMGSKEGWRNVVACYALGEGVPQCQQTAKYIAKTMLSEE